jgi:hypothetical protein
MRRPVSERDAVGSQVIDALEAQEIRETRLRSGKELPIRNLPGTGAHGGS